MDTDIAYWTNRLTQERQRVETAQRANVALAHERMAGAYEAKLAELMADVTVN